VYARVVIDTFERDGFLVLPGFVAAAACDALIERAAQLVHERTEDIVSIFSTHEQTRTSDAYFLTSGDQIRCFFEEDGRTVNKLGHAMHDLDPVFDRFSRTPELAALAKQIMVDPVLLQSMFIFKAAHTGGEVTLHTDHTFLWTEPQSATGFWFALEDATLENGCMWAVPGSHRSQPVRARFRRAGAGTTFDVLDDRPIDLAGEVPLVAPKGTCIVLHGLVQHRSGPNTSARSRQAYTVHCIERGARYPDDNWLRRAPDLPLRGF